MWNKQFYNNIIFNLVRGSVLRERERVINVPCVFNLLKLLIFNKKQRFLSDVFYFSKI